MRLDVTSYGIRVIMDPKRVNKPCSAKPIDVEGTVLFLDTASKTTTNAIEQGRILEVLTHGLWCGVAKVRWDTDVRGCTDFGNLLIRNPGRAYCCRSIWTHSKTPRFDERDYRELRPDTGCSVKSQVKFRSFAEAYGGLKYVPAPMTGKISAGPIKTGRAKAIKALMEEVRQLEPMTYNVTKDPVTGELIKVPVPTKVEAQLIDVNFEEEYSMSVPPPVLVEQDDDLSQWHPAYYISDAAY